MGAAPSATANEQLPSRDGRSAFEGGLKAASKPLSLRRGAGIGGSAHARGYFGVAAANDCYGAEGAGKGIKDGEAHKKKGKEPVERLKF
ncbi:Uncharacterised protein [Candidatus Gugararchaeum adminiculabundum]|nr:Uncharacterised protein [Candidatus Gugararchaeum adminiculabundum]